MKFEIVVLIILFAVLVWLVMKNYYKKNRDGYTEGLCQGFQEAGWGTYNLSWDAPSNNGGDPNCCTYIISITDSSDGTPIVPATTVTTNSFSLDSTSAASGWQWNSTYDVSIAAVNSTGQGLPAAFSFDTCPMPNPSAPSNLTVGTPVPDVSGNFYIPVTWGAATPSSPNAPTCCTNYDVAITDSTGTTTYLTDVNLYCQDLSLLPRDRSSNFVYSSGTTPPLGGSMGYNWYMSGTPDADPGAWTSGGGYTVSVKGYQCGSGGPGTGDTTTSIATVTVANVTASLASGISNFSASWSA